MSVTVKRYDTDKVITTKTMNAYRALQLRKLLKLVVAGEYPNSVKHLAEDLLGEFNP